MPRKKEKALLSFASFSQRDMAPFPTDAERAAIFCLAELERDKGGGLIKKQPPEELVFIAEVFYPFWVVPFGDSSLLFDGMNISSHSIIFSPIPDPKTFKNKLERRFESHQAYHTFLSDNANNFQISIPEETKTIDGLITDSEFLREFRLCLEEAILTKAPVAGSVLISPAPDEASIKSIIRGLRESQSGLIVEKKGLFAIMRLLNSKTQKCVSTLRNEIKKTEEKFDKEIEKSKELLLKRTVEINKEYTQKVTKVSKRFEKELLIVQKERIKVEKTKKQLANEIEQSEAEIRAAAIRKDDVSKKKWKEKRSSLKKELSGAPNAKVKELEERIGQIEENKKLMVFKLKSKHDSKVKEASKDLIEIESSRDAEIKIYRDEMEKLEELTSGIIEQVDKLLKTRDTVIAEFEGLGLQLKRQTPLLAYMPFYLVCFKSNSKKRYVFFPPSFVSSEGLGVRLKGAIGKTKIKELLHPRSKKFVSILNKFILLMEKNVVFNREIDAACSKANILIGENRDQSIQVGLKTLQEEGWLSHDKYEFFRSLLE